MTIAGTLSVTASDDPRFVAGDTIGIVLDAGLDITVTQAIEVSAPVVSTPTSTETESSGDVVAGEVESSTDGSTETVTPATA